MACHRAVTCAVCNDHVVTWVLTGEPFNDLDSLEDHCNFLIASLETGTDSEFPR